MPQGPSTFIPLSLLSLLLPVVGACTGPTNDSSGPELQLRHAEEGESELAVEVDFDGCVGSRATLVRHDELPGDTQWSFDGDDDAAACLVPGPRAATFATTQAGSYVLRAELEDGQSIEVELEAEDCAPRPATCAGTVLGHDEGIGGSCDCPDDDADGVPDDEDRCPDTSPNAKAMIAGCDLGALTGRPEHVLAEGPESLADLVEAVDRADVDPESRLPFAAAAEEVQLAADAALAALEDGELCTAAAHWGSAAEAFGAVGEALSELASSEPLPAPGGDVGPFEQWAVGQMRLQQLTTKAQEEFAVRGGELAELCDQVEPGVEFRGTVVKIDNEARTVELDSGVEIIIPGDAEAIYVGSSASGKGDQLGDSLVAVEDWVGGVLEALTSTGEEQACTWLGIAPVQPFWPISSGAPIIHDPDAYVVPILGPAMQLEKGMRLAAVTKSCPSSGTDDVIDIEGRYGSLTKALYFDVAPGQVPLTIDPTEGGQALDQLEITVKRPCEPSESCDYEIVAIHKWDVSLSERGSQCEAVFDKVAFAGDELAPGEFRNGVMTGFNDSGELLTTTANTGAWIQAEGYTTSYYTAGGQVVATTSYPVLETIGVFDVFAVFKDAIPAGSLMSWLTYGVPDDSAIAWPKVVGTRNGKPYSYSCDVPDIRRDLVTECSTSPDSSYRLPFAHNQGDFFVGQGNMSTPPASHSVGWAQQYAWDISMPVGTYVRAARPGTITAVLDEEWRGFDCSTLPDQSPLCEWQDVTQIPPVNSAPPPGGWTCAPMSNFIFVTHEDGTHAVYFHLKNGGAMVTVGQKVARGQIIAQSGNVGCSTGPHLHFHQDTTNVADTGVSEPVRFYHQLWNDDDEVYETKSCSIPQAGDTIRAAP